MLEIRNLGYRAAGEGGETEILRDVNLRVEPNKFVVITGPNGGGKTSLAKAVMGIITPTEGQVLWNGEDITGLDVTARARRGIGYAFQQPPRFKGLRVRDLLTLAAGGGGLTHEQGCQYLTRVGLCANDYIEREMDTSLSGGEIKRIEIATVLAKQGGLMIFDEPEAGIDLWSFARLTETFRDIQQARTATLLVISHQERIINLADEIVLMRNGTVAAQGARDEIYPRILADTIGECTYMQREVAQ